MLATECAALEKLAEEKLNMKRVDLLGPLVHPEANIPQTSFLLHIFIDFSFSNIFVMIYLIEKFVLP